MNQRPPNSLLGTSTRELVMIHSVAIHSKIPPPTRGGTRALPPEPECLLTQQILCSLGFPHLLMDRHFDHHLDQWTLKLQQPSLAAGSVGSEILQFLLSFFFTLIHFLMCYFLCLYITIFLKIMMKTATYLLSIASTLF